MSVYKSIMNENQQLIDLQKRNVFFDSRQFCLFEYQNEK